MLAVCVVLGTAAGAYRAWSQTPVYAAKEDLFVSVTAAVDPGAAYQGALLSQQRVASYARIVASPTVMERVIRRLDLPEDVPTLQGKISAVAIPDTVLIAITVRDPSPRRAVAVVRAVGDEFAALVGTLEKPDAKSASPVSVRVASPALTPATPTSPHRTLLVALGLALGLFAGIGLAVAREVLDDRVSDRVDAEQLLGAPTIGTLVDVPDGDQRRIVAADAPESTTAQAYRQLWSMLHLRQTENGTKSFLVTSAVPAEGKSLVAANLAVTFARAGQQVILVDADLRDPHLADILGLEDGRGLADALADGQPTLAEPAATTDALPVNLQSWRADLPLRVLTAGRSGVDPSELVSRGKLDALVTTLASMADVVIIDGPAVLAGGDTPLVANAAGEVVVVMSAGVTRQRDVHAAALALATADARVTGVVLKSHPQGVWRWLVPAPVASGNGDEPR